MTAEFANQKTFSVVLHFDQFDSINGKIASFQTESERKSGLDSFFKKKYGHGEGRLEIEYSSTKAKLTWVPRQYVPEAEIAHSEATNYAKNRQFKQAIGTWVKAIALNSTDPDYYFNLGIAFFELKNYQEAIENLAKSIELCPIYHKAHLILGTIYLKVRKFELAEKHLQESIVFYPNHPLAYLNLGAVYSIMKQYDDAIKMFLRCIELSPKEVRAHFGLAKIFSLKHESQKADYYYQQVIDIGSNEQLTIHAQRSLASHPEVPEPSHEGHVAMDPVEAQKYYQEGYRAYIFGDYERAVQMYEAYLGSRTSDDYVWFSLGEASLRAGNVMRAVEAFKSALKHNPSKGLYYKELAISFNQLGNESEAAEMLDKAEKLGKCDSVSYTIWGKVLIRQANFEEACAKLEKALKLNSNNLLAKYNLAIALMRTNARQDAANYLHEIVKAPVKSPLKLEAENLLRQI